MTLQPFPKSSNGPLPWLGWSFSLLLPLALILLILTAIFGGGQDVIEIRVHDDTGNPMPGARVLAANSTYVTDDNGSVRLAVSDQEEQVTIERDGYVTMVGSINSSSGSIPPIVMHPAAGVAQASASPAAGQSSTVAASSPVSTPISASPSVAGKSGEVAGVVTDTAGDPIVRAWITDGKSYAFTDDDGAFVFDKGTVSPEADLTITASGYRQVTVTMPADGTPLDAKLELQPIKGIYYNPNITTTDEEVDELIQLIDNTELNAVVIDVKEELVFYDTHVQFFQDAGVVVPIMDLDATLKKFHDHGIYTIARLVVFKDSAVAEKYPDLGVKDTETGDLWRDMNGIAWVNPMLHELWDHNIDLAYEAATRGFDEIQYDYVRFPTDGDLSRVEYGLPNTQENRQNAIEKLLEKTRETLMPTGVRLSADIFGYTVKVDDDLGIGQNVPRLAPHVDYLSPMIYPSHWPEGSVPVDGHPNDFPYETIKYSMELALDKLDGDGMKLRPWLQDFNMPGMMEYGAKEVRAQIDAVEELGLSGWLIWDPNNWYHDDAFTPDSGSNQPETAIPAATPQAVSQGTGAKTRRARTPSSS
ncbi:MAG TPA: putative glycoside hydrolase [Thermomicrobiales bacterium]|nr:putative glycoside hydrolase [Thermomicrobiales bacterium]